MARVLLDNVTKTFDGSVTAVLNVTLDVRDGELVVIVGPSGCGKTTTLRLIAGLETPTRGNIFIGDDLVNDVAPRERDVAMVFQNYALYPHMSVFENLAFPLRAGKVAKDQINKRVEDTAAMLGISGLLKRRPTELSGGQRQRVALGRAIIRNPKAFLFDEPLANLDAKLRAAMRAELKAIHGRRHTTTIYVTHDQAEAMSLGERICVMHNGVIQQTAEPLELYEKPVNKFVAGFIGTPAMNFFAGQVQLSQHEARFVTGSDIIILPRGLRTAIADLNNRTMFLGVRPEHISPRPFAGQAGNTISARVDSLEFTGGGRLAHLSSAAGDKFTVYLERRAGLKPNETLRMHIDLEKIHIFEPGETGRNVIAPALG